MYAVEKIRAVFVCISLKNLICPLYIGQDSHSGPNSLSTWHGCPVQSFRFIEVILWGFDQKTAGAEIFVRFSQVSALEDVRFR